MTGAVALWLYRALGRLATPLIHRQLRRRLQAGKEDPARLAERLGHARLPRPSGALLWIHAASVGESLSVLPLIERIRASRPAIRILLTTGTVTSARLLADRLPEAVLHQFAPIDTSAAMARFLDHWRPNGALFVESELWPVTLLELDRRGIPRALVNGRMSARSFRRWSRLRGLAARLLGGFRPCLAQSADDLRRFQALGAGQASSPGNLKAAASPLPVDAAALAQAQAALAGRPCWVAASTHPGEEVLIAGVHASLVGEFPRLMTVLVPRHAGRGPDIARDLAAAGAAVGLRSRGDPLGAHPLYIADTMGELGLWYRLCPIAFIGKSLVGEGGQNPLEAAQLGAAILHGPQMSNFRQIVCDLAEAAGATEVPDAAALQRALAALLRDPEQARRQAERAAAVAGGNENVLAATLAALAPLLAAMEAHPSA